MWWDGELTKNDLYSLVSILYAYTILYALELFLIHHNRQQFRELGQAIWKSFVVSNYHQLLSN